ncbi:MAG: Rrf2 family transcriptional regulator [Chlorobiota bacterium]|jgi:Rrf2 family protein|nr:Rrf2 family transcriptional regulator [Chlorobiota bacterium]QQS66045.1 MAG: Rrf2 family transcriptional regulator [Chlorobiota bacterium]
MFSKACEYAIRATIFIALQTKNKIIVSLKDISKEIDSPIAFTGKILQSLANKNILKSIKGAGGGYEINVSYKNNSINLYDIVVAIDGENLFKSCGIGLKECNSIKPCPIHNEYKIIREGLVKLLVETTINKLVIDSKKLDSFLKN